ncbi:MAG: hypothetical protein WC783_02865 [Candidatus Paceibacterota bacterium]
MAFQWNGNIEWFFKDINAAKVVLYAYYNLEDGNLYVIELSDNSRVQVSKGEWVVLDSDLYVNVYKDDEVNKLFKEEINGN